MRSYFKRLRWWKIAIGCVVVSLLGGYVGYRLYMNWLDRKYIKEHPVSFGLIIPMAEANADLSIDDFVPPDCPTGEIYWIDVKSEQKLSKVDPQYQMYAVRLDPKGPPIRLRAAWSPRYIQSTEYVGFLAWPGPNGKVDYSTEDNSVILNDFSDHPELEGDVIFFLKK